MISIMKKAKKEGRLTIRISQHEAGARFERRLYIKEDGTRFSDGRTLRLEAETRYIMRLEINPPEKSLESVTINLKDVGFFETLSIENNKRKYQIIFETSSAPHTVEKCRDTLTICMQLKEVGHIIIPVQVKYYREGTKRLTEGLAMDCIDVKFLSWDKNDVGETGFEIKSAILMAVATRKMNPNRPPRIIETNTND